MYYNIHVRSDESIDPHIWVQSINNNTNMKFETNSNTAILCLAHEKNITLSTCFFPWFPLLFRWCRSAAYELRGLIKLIFCQYWRDWINCFRLWYFLVKNKIIGQSKCIRNRRGIIINKVFFSFAPGEVYRE